MRSVILLFAIYCLLSVAQALNGQTSNVVVQTVDGEKTVGQITGLEFDSISIQTSDQKRTLSFEQVDSINTEAKAKTPIETIVHIQLVDGTNFHAKTFSIASSQLTAELYCQTTVTVGTRNVASIRFTTYEESLRLGKQWRKIIEDNSREGDAIVVNRSDELDAVEGIVNDVNDGKLGFSIGERTARVALEKMDAILFYHAAGRELSKAVCEMTLVDNSRIAVRRMGWKNEGIAVTTVCGSQLQLKLDVISRLSFSFGRNVMLSSIEPSTNDWQALMTSPAILEKLRKLRLARANESFSGQPLSLKFSPEPGQGFSAETKQFEHGYAVQGGGKLAFSLDGQFKNLTGLVGFAPQASRSGHVKLIVLVDGKTVVEQELIHRQMKNPISLDLNIENANRVVFQVEYQDGRSTGDQLHLVNLKVSQ